MTENSVKQSQKMNTVSALIQSGTRNPDHMNAVRITFSGKVLQRSYNVIKC
jgi:hypothetical protein